MSASLWILVAAAVLGPLGWAVVATRLLAWLERRARVAARPDDRDYQI
jgi:hypothetical protein